MEDQVKQLTELMAALIPVVDRLTQNQEKNTETINQVKEIIAKTNLGMSEMRVSNMRLADAIEKLAVKIDKIDQFEDRLIKLEQTVFK
ncbi:MAG: hypothetical protein ING84_12600 [Cytophagales bacterium]|jgi:hypothetical protein|nr:hypothetical protein [Cytophagales bacterium]MCA6368776.1 hypothetical protein [Cytophagales bacterium]MCA6377727.1 hypothetical protein [Cytophagales bacterium]MCA6385848.1 hypothetical protein [Cytophagales bacterium]